MARDHARLRLDIWSDPQWRALPMPSQWLYTYLLSSPKLTYAGVADWRPKRIAKFTKDGRFEDVEVAAHYLETAHDDHAPFVIIDRDSEEALIRTFIRHDGIMGVPNVAIACVKAWQDTASEVLRQVVAWEIQHLYADRPEMPAFQDGAASWLWLQEVLDHEVINPSEAYEELDPNPYDGQVKRYLRGVQ